MRYQLSMFILAFIFLVPANCAQTKTINFDSDAAGQKPAGFSFTLTGQGTPGTWVIVIDETSPGQKNVLAQTSEDATSYRFPVALFDAITASDLDISVKFRTISGRKDQAAGMVWRYRDKDNYYVVRANALENNVVMYKVENGTRTDLPLKGEGRTYGKKTSVPRNQWNTLRAVAAGSIFEVYLNGSKLYEVEDTTFKEAGKVGLWTKADSVTHFDDLQITVK